MWKFYFKYAVPGSWASLVLWALFFLIAATDDVIFPNAQRWFVQLFEKDGQKYVLEYTRESVALMERQGFSVEELTTKPMLMLPLAFQGLFYKNHRRVNKTFVDEVYDNFKDKEKLLEAIATMLEECYSSLTDNKEDDKGNIDWKIV